MDKAQFTRLFHEASMACVTFARNFVTDHLPDAILYDVIPNASYDGNPLLDEERVFPEDSLPPDEFHCMTGDQAIDFLWREGRVPEWVDLSVVAVKQDHTIIELLCCGRFTANNDLLYYVRANRGPFGVKGPALPPDYDQNNPTRFALFNPRELRQRRRQSSGGDSEERA